MHSMGSYMYTYNHRWALTPIFVISNIRLSLISELFQTMGSQGRDVVLVGRTIDLGKPRGVGKLEWGRNGEGEVNLPATWDQGGRGSHHAKRRDSK